MYIEGILRRYPEAVPGKDFILRDDGDGMVYVSDWKIDGLQPTQDTLKQWYDEEMANNPPVVPISPEEKIKQLETELVIAKEDNISNMLAITEIYEMMLGGGT